jgi:hypothetical protein
LTFLCYGNIEFDEGVEHSVADPHHFDANPDSGPDPTFHFDEDPNPDPTFHSDAGSDPDPTFQFDEDMIRTGGSYPSPFSSFTV